MRTSGAFSQRILTGLNTALIALIASAALFISGFKNNTKLGEAPPSESEGRGAHRMALRVSAGMPRHFAKRDHDWLIAQARNLFHVMAA
ncbi:hypothetical protein AO064_10845 [Pseudomonas marginalis]|uniref:Uncharacterized protein n=1 Tax=Pseudomonas marginalis TaxID=298 RepID=A0A9X5KW05_PSEMA|nr:hypothetical protein AO064_10845 [Pseudomonas marginalis]